MIHASESHNVSFKVTAELRREVKQSQDKKGLFIVERLLMWVS